MNIHGDKDLINNLLKKAKEFNITTLRAEISIQQDCGTMLFDCHPDVRLRVKWGLSINFEARYTNLLTASLILSFWSWEGCFYKLYISQSYQNVFRVSTKVSDCKSLLCLLMSAYFGPIPPVKLLAVVDNKHCAALQPVQKVTLCVQNFSW